MLISRPVFSLAKEITSTTLFNTRSEVFALAVLSKVKRKEDVYETLDNSVYIRVHSQQENFFYLVLNF